MRKHLVVAVIPSLNEEEGIGPTLDEYLHTIPGLRVLVVDGGSNDRTIEIAREKGAETLFSNGGKGSAVAEALRFLREEEGEIAYIIFTDADYSYPATRILEMINILDNEPAVGAVLGDRFREKRPMAYLSDIYSFGNMMIRQFYRAWRAIELNDPLSGLRVVRWLALRDWSPTSRGFEIETEMNLYLLRNGWLIKEIPIHYRKRLGEKKLRISDAFPILKMLLTYDSRV